MQQFEITYYWGPQGGLMGTDRCVSAIAEAGFTAVPLENGTAPENKQALAQLAAHGLTCCALWDSRIAALTEHTADAPQAQVDRVVAEVAADYADFSNLTGWWLKDEPSAAHFPILAKTVDAFRRLDPGRATFIDLYPTYASPAQLGTDSYDSYVRRFVETVRPSYLCYDHYHFMADGTCRPGFFENMERIRAAGQEYGLETMTIQLLTAHMGYADITRAQLSWEVNMALAYGMHRLSYFTFFLSSDLMAEGWTDACMNSRGELYPHYADVQAVNAWALPLGRELYGKRSAGVFHLGGLPEPGCRSCDGQAPGPAEGTDFVLGLFDDGSFMAVNKRHSAGTSNVLTLPRLTAAQWFDPADGAWKDAALCPAVTLSPGGCTLTLADGAALLLRPQP